MKRAVGILILLGLWAISIIGDICIYGLKHTVLKLIFTLGITALVVLAAHLICS